MVKGPAPVVRRICEGGTIVCLGSGPSLTVADVDYIRGRAAAVIAINDAIRLAPWASVLYACDAKWWYWHAADLVVTAFEGPRYALDPAAGKYAGVQVLRKTGERGLERDPSGLRAGRNSGYQAINLAVHLGASRVVLLGFDMKGDHFFGHHPDQSRPPFATCLERFATLVPELAAVGVEVVNCSPGSALRCFPMRSLREVFPAPALEAVPA